MIPKCHHIKLARFCRHKMHRKWRMSSNYITQIHLISTYFGTFPSDNCFYFSPIDEYYQMSQSYWQLTTIYQLKLTFFVDVLDNANHIWHFMHFAGLFFAHQLFKKYSVASCQRYQKRYQKLLTDILNFYWLKLNYNSYWWVPLDNCR